MRTLITLAIAACALPLGAQTIYRCGNAYSELPCSLARVPEINRFEARIVSDAPAPGWADSPPLYEPYYLHRGYYGHGHQGQHLGGRGHLGGGRGGRR